MRFIIALKSIFTGPNNPIAGRLAIRILLASIVISLISTSALIYSNQKENTEQFESQIQTVKTNNLPSLVNALWYFDQMQINTQGEWISSLPRINYVNIASRNESLFKKGSLSNISKNDLFTIPINYNTQLIGNLEIGFSHKDGASSLLQSAEKLILLQLILGLLLALILLWVAHQLITRHRADINELDDTIDRLNDTQTRLIESEKLSSLGSLVAGVAHEVKTPLGLCITTHSFIKDLFRELQEHVDAGNITKENFEDYRINMEECVDILSNNLDRTSKLVESFKHISEDQAGEILRSFNLSSYLKEILSTLTPKIRTTKHSVNIHCPDDITLTGYPGALSQVIINLIINSLQHGFEGKEQGIISINAEQQGNDIIITYSDDGLGLTKEVEKNIFTPFYTTKKDSGGTGLGMHIVKTLTEQTLQGSIQLQPASKGCAFLITLPRMK